MEPETTLPSELDTTEVSPVRLEMCVAHKALACNHANLEQHGYHEDLNNYNWLVRYVVCLISLVLTHCQ